VVTKEVEPFAVAQISRLLGAFEGERLGALYLLALSHGLRQGEALGLKWEDVDLKAKTLRVRHALQWVEGKPQLVETKTKQSKRQVALTDRVLTSLRTHRQVQLEDRLRAGGAWEEHGLVFSTQRGRPLDGTNVLRDFKRMLKKAALPGRRFHDLRHTTASLLMHQNVHPRVVMDLLGHSEFRVTMDLYSHVGPVLQRGAAEQMDILLNTAEAAGEQR
jgi:integrase